MFSAKNNDLYFIIFLSLITFFSRFLLKPIKYFHNIDSYAYLNIVNTGVMFDNTVLSSFTLNFGITGTLIVLYIFNIMLVIVFYLCLRQKFKQIPSAAASLLFILSPLVFFFTQPEIYDKTIFVLPLFVFCLLCYDLSVIKKSYYYLILLFISIVLISMYWQGWYLIAAIFIFMFFMRYLLNKQYYIAVHYGMILLLFSIKLIPMIKSITMGYTSGFLIAETAPLIFLPFHWEYLVMYAVLIYIFTFKIDEKSIITFIIIIMSMAIFRNVIFALPFMYYYVARFFDKSGKRIMYAVFIIIILLFLADGAIYVRDPVMNDNFKHAMDYFNTLNSTCLASNWGNGHIYRYYTNKTVLFSAHPNDLPAVMDWLVFGNRTNCTVLWYDRDYFAMDLLVDYYKINITKGEYWMTTVEPDIMFGNVRVIKK